MAGQPRPIMVKRMDGAVYESTDDKIPELLQQWGSDRVCVIAWNMDPVYYELMNEMRKQRGE